MIFALVAIHSTRLKELKEFREQYSRYFVDIWQYLVIIVIFILVLLFVL